MAKINLKAEIAAMDNEELIENLIRSTRIAWTEFLGVYTREERRKVVYGKNHYRERRLATEVLRRMNSA